MSREGTQQPQTCLRAAPAALKDRRHRGSPYED